MSSTIKEFLDKFFDLCREYQEEIPPHKMAEVLRDYADRLDELKLRRWLVAKFELVFNYFAIN